MSWSDNRRISTDIGWYMPYFTTAEYGWQVREPIHDMLIRIVDNTYDPEYTPDYRDEIHFIADQMMAPDRKIDGKDCRYVSTMKKFLVRSFHTLDLSRAQWEYVAPGVEPYPFDESCDDEIISIWNATDPTIVREQSYKAFMKLAYGDWINYDKKCTLAESPKTVVCTSFTRVTVHGTTNGLGTMILGKNYLEQRTTPIPNGAAGSYLSYTNAFTDNIYAHNGYTFNSGNATRAAIFLQRIGESTLPKANVGNMMLVEGSTIPSAYDADTNLYKDDILQGSFRSCAPESWTEGSQFLYSGDEPGGTWHDYGQAQSWSDTHCKTYAFPVEQNTDYSVRFFNSSYTDMVLMVLLFTEPGIITPTYTNVGGKSIPGNETFVTNDEQWVELNYSNYQTREYRPRIPVDSRPLMYDYCESFADLKAGTYKLMVDIWANNDMDTFVGCQSYTGCTLDNYDGDSTNIIDWFALIGEDNTAIISKTSLFDDNVQDHRIKRKDAGAPYPNFYHKEFTFTLESNTKVGLIHKAYYTSIRYSYPPFFRFYIVDADEEADEFTTTGVTPVNMSGYSAWEKYQKVVSISVKFTDVIANTSTTLTKTVPNLLYSSDFVNFTEDLPTYYSSEDYGIVTVEVLDKDQEDPTIVPTIDISYH